MRSTAASLILVAASAATASSPLPRLLAHAIEASEAAKGLVAEKVRTHLEVYDGHEAFLGALDTVDAIDSFRKEGPPARRTLSTKTQGSP